LRDREGDDLAVALVALGQLGVDVGNGAVGGAEVDPDHGGGPGALAGVGSLAAGGGLALLAHSSTSAGASTRGSVSGTGTWTLLVRHPWCMSVPLKGGSPLTLPESAIATGSNPAGTVTGVSSSPGRIGSSASASSSTLRQPLWIARTAAPTCSSS